MQTAMNKTTFRLFDFQIILYHCNKICHRKEEESTVAL